MHILLYNNSGNRFFNFGRGGGLGFHCGGVGGRNGGRNNCGRRDGHGHGRYSNVQCQNLTQIWP